MQDSQAIHPACMRGLQIAIACTESVSRLQVTCIAKRFGCKPYSNALHHMAGSKTSRLFFSLKKSCLGQESLSWILTHFTYDSRSLFQLSTSKPVNGADAIFCWKTNTLSSQIDWMNNSINNNCFVITKTINSMFQTENPAEFGFLPKGNSYITAPSPSWLTKNSKCHYRSISLRYHTLWYWDPRKQRNG